MTSDNKFSHLQKRIVSRRVYEHPKTGEVLPRQLRADQLCPHPENPKIHPEDQKRYIAALIDTYGQVDDVKINVNNGYLIDGHARAWLALGYADDVLVDVDWYDIGEDEHKALLPAFDYVTQLAQIDRDILDSLLHDVQTDDERLQAMLSEMAEEHGLIESLPPDDFPEYDEDIDTDYRCPKCGYEWSGKPQ